MHLLMSSAIWQTFDRGLNVLIERGRLSTDLHWANPGFLLPRGHNPFSWNTRWWYIGLMGIIGRLITPSQSYHLSQTVWLNGRNKVIFKTRISINSESHDAWSTTRLRHLRYFILHDRGCWCTHFCTVTLTKATKPMATANGIISHCLLAKL